MSTSTCDESGCKEKAVFPEDTPAFCEACAACPQCCKKARKIKTPAKWDFSGALLARPTLFKICASCIGRKGHAGKRKREPEEEQEGDETEVEREPKPQQPRSNLDALFEAMASVNGTDLLDYKTLRKERDDAVVARDVFAEELKQEKKAHTETATELAKVSAALLIGSREFNGLKNKVALDKEVLVKHITFMMDHVQTMDSEHQ